MTGRQALTRSLAARLLALGPVVSAFRVGAVDLGRQAARPVRRPFHRDIKTKRGPHGLPAHWSTKASSGLAFALQQKSRHADVVQEMCAGRGVKGRGFDLLAVDGGTAGCVTCSTDLVLNKLVSPGDNKPRGSASPRQESSALAAHAGICSGDVGDSSLYRDRPGLAANRRTSLRLATVALDVAQIKTGAHNARSRRTSRPVTQSPSLTASKQNGQRISIGAPPCHAT
jgi:hypothetical protein